MDFGVIFANIMFFADGPGARTMGTSLEAAGFESVWTVEHVLIPDGYESEYPYDKSGRMPGDGMADMPDPLIWLSYVAAHTERLNLATGILIVPQRNPGILAKEVASLDRLSGGRMILGVGAGWLAEEFDALGVPFERRGARLDEYVAAMRALWRDHKATFSGEFCGFTDAVSLPKPMNGAVPIVVGGHTEVAARRAGRLGDGFFPGRGTPDELRSLVTLMRQTAEDAGRDPAAIDVTFGSPAVFGSDPVGACQELADIGVTRVVIPPPSFSPDELPDACAAFGRDVIAKVNA